MILKQMGNEHPKSRRQFITDLIKQLQEWNITDEDHLILQMDANEAKGTGSNGINDLLFNFNLVDTFEERL